MWPFKKKQAAAAPEVKRPQPKRSGRIITSIGEALANSERDQTFVSETRTIAEVIRDTLTTVRGQQRTLEQDNDYLGRYLTELEENVIGGSGFRFQSGVMRANGEFNKPVNDRLEEWWKRQSDPANYTVEGEHSGMDETAADKLILRSVARDGFCFIRVIENFENDTRFAIQIMSGDVLDHTMCDVWNGRRITNGVETDEWGRVRGYHIMVANGGTGSVDGKHSFLPADDIIFPFVRTRIGQRAGMPWARTVGQTFHGLDEYEKAVLVSAREAACKSLNYEQDIDNPIGLLTEDDLSGDIQPGEANLLPPGVKAVPYDPSQPTDTYGDYRQGLLMRAASGLNMSYQSLSGDLSGGNFASQRVGLLDEREIWKGKQGWFCQAVKFRIYKRALRMGLLVTPGLPETMASLERLYAPIFRGRRWAWVDPQKDLTAAKIGVEMGFTSREKIISDSDSDTDEEGVLRAIKRGKDLEEEMGLNLGEPPPQQQSPTNQQENEQEEAQATNVVAI